MFMNFSVNFVILILTAKRENENSVSVMWRVFSDVSLILLRVALYSLPHDL